VEPLTEHGAEPPPLDGWAGGLQQRGASAVPEQGDRGGPCLLRQGFYDRPEFIRPWHTPPRRDSRICRKLISLGGLLALRSRGLWRRDSPDQLALISPPARFVRCGQRSGSRRSQALLHRPGVTRAGTDERLATYGKQWVVCCQNAGFQSAGGSAEEMGSASRLGPPRAVDCAPPGARRSEVAGVRFAGKRRSKPARPTVSRVWIQPEYSPPSVWQTGQVSTSSTPTAAVRAEHLVSGHCSIRKDAGSAPATQPALAVGDAPASRCCSGAAGARGREEQDPGPDRL